MPENGMGYKPALGRFLAITFGFSWLIWVGIALAKPFGETPTVVLSVFAAFGPTLAAIVLITFFCQKKYAEATGSALSALS